MIKKTANMEIKKVNRTNIFQLLRQSSGLTKQNIVATLQLCLPTVTQNINELQSEGLIAESGSVGNTGGRRARAYDIIREARTAIGVDITSNHVTVVVVDLTGSVSYCLRTRRKFEQTDSYYRYLGDLVHQAVTEAQLDESRVLGVGIAVPGLVTNDHETVFFGKILNFTGATCSEFSKYIPYEARLFNDANAAGFAEIWSCKELKNAFYLMLSNNVGGSVVIDSKIYAGEHLRSGEVGHMCIVPNGRDCYCGQKGCVDSYLAATKLSALTDGNLAAFFLQLKNSDKNALAVWATYQEHLVMTVNNLHMVFDCPIILGGYVGEYIGDYLTDIQALAGQHNTFEDNADYLRVCSYRTEAIAAGAALNFITRFLNSI